MITIKIIVGVIGLILLAYAILKVTDIFGAPDANHQDKDHEYDDTVSYDEMVAALGEDMQNAKKQEFFKLMKEYEEHRDIKET